MADLEATMTPAPLSVAFVGEAIETGDVAKTDLEAAIADSPLVTLAETEESADMRVVAQPNSIFRLYPKESSVALAAFRIPVKKVRSLQRKLRSILEQIVAFRNLSEIEAPESYIEGTVKIDFVQLLEPATRGSLKEPAAAPLRTNDAGEYVLGAGKNLAIAFEHSSPNPLYFYVVSLDRRLQSASLVYPYKVEFSARAKGDDPVLLVGAGPDYLLEMQVPEGYSDGLDVFKIFISQSAIEPDIFRLPNLGTRKDVPTDYYGSGARLDRDLRKVMLGETGTAPIPQFGTDPWWCTERLVRVVRED